MLKRLSLAAAAASVASPAFAHLDAGAHGSFLAGLSHPLFGLDHILAMVAVGLWAAMLGGRAVAAVPAAFVGTMMVGFGLALAGAGLPLVEPAIQASVIVLGLVVAMAVRLPVAGGAALVAVFAVFHGFAHGTELGGAGASTFMAGFALATAALHGIGIAAGLGLAARMPDARPAGGGLTRLLGAATAVLGVGLSFGVV